MELGEKKRRAVDKVPPSSDLVRIAKLPRRFYSPEELEWLADEMTARIKTPNGQMRLRPIQAQALFELGTVGGMFGILRVGAGKTLISLLASVALKAQRPLIIVPAKLEEKTKRDMEVLAQHFRLPPWQRIMTYEWLGREQAGQDEETGRPDALDEWNPDLVSLDECQKAKSIEAAVTKRLRRFFRTHNQARCAAMSGTATKRSILDFAHILTWCLPAKLLPIPTHWNDLELWSLALDERKSENIYIDPEALEALCFDQEDLELWRNAYSPLDRRQAARVVFRKRLVQTPGVVSTVESPIDATLTIRALRVELSADIDAAFAHMRPNWETPDGWSIADGMEMARHARDLCLGFYLRWDPRPPFEWVEPRKAWHKFVREILKHSRKLDSELPVRKWAAACTRRQQEGERLNEREQEAVARLGAWQAVCDTFVPNTVPVWIDASMLEFAAEWARTRVGIVWCENPCVGQRLRDEFGLEYYGREGLNRAGRLIDDHSPKKSLCASIRSSGEGRNLQAWCKNLTLDLPTSGDVAEQLIGRTHRDGQEADEVEFEFVVSCREHVDAYEQLMRDTRYIESITGSPQKAMLAGHDIDPRVMRGNGPRWWANERRDD